MPNSLAIYLRQMMKLSQLLVAVFLLSSYSLNAQSTLVREGCEPFAVQFTGTGFYWEFGDGTVSNVDNPSHVYSAAGVYTVDVYDFNGGNLESSFDITVHEIPTVTIAANVVEGCSPLQVDFSYSLPAGSTIPVTGAKWIFGDGNVVNSGGATISHTYVDNGVYTVSLELETGLSTCKVNASQTDFITVNAGPQASFDMDPASACSAPQLVTFDNTTFDNTSSVNYTWDFDNGVTSNLEFPPSQNYTTEGTYNIQLTAENANGCIDSVTQTLNIGSQSGTIDVPDTVCLNIGVIFESNGANVEEWDFGTDAQDINGNPITTSGANSIEIFYTAPGEKTVELTTNNGGCSNTVTKDIFVQGISINPSVSEAFHCENPITIDYGVTTDADTPSFEWMFFNDSVITDQNPSFTYYTIPDSAYNGEDGGFIYSTLLTVTDETTGCFDTLSVDFEHSPLSTKASLISGSALGCPPQEYRFVDSTYNNLLDPIVNITWEYGDGSPTENFTTELTEVTHEYTTPGSYDVFVIAESSLGCMDTSYQITMQVGTDLTGSIDFTADQTNVCLGETVQLSVISPDPAIDAFHFYADGNRIFHQPDLSVVSWDFEHEVGAQDVTLVVDAGGCLSEITKTNFITVEGARAIIAYGADCDAPTEYKFESQSISSSGGLDLSWDFGDANSSLAADPTHTYATSGDYEVFLSASDPASACPAHIDSVTVTVRVPYAELDPVGPACGGDEITFNASNSEDAACRGYTFMFPTFGSAQRPITWDNDFATIEVPFIDTVGNSHEVILIIKDDNGCTDSDTITFEPYTFEIGGMPDESSLCSGQSMTLTDTTISDNPIVERTWVISTGESIIATGADTTFVANIEPPGGTYTFELQVVDDFGCVSTQEEVFNVPFGPIRARIDQLDNLICAPDTINFEAIDVDSKGLTFSWDFGNDSTGTGTDTATVYTEGGFYEVKLVFAEPSSVCIDSIFTTVEIQENPLAGFMTDADALPVFCSPQTITFTDTSFSTSSIASLDWDFDNGETSNTSTYGLLYPKGIYDVELIAETSFGCADTVIRTFNVVGPEASFTIDDNQICEGDEVLFEIQDKVDVDSLIWFFGDGNDAINVDAISHQYTSSTSNLQNIATLLIYSDNGCVQALDTTISFHEVIAGFDLTNNEGEIDTLACVDDLIFAVDQSVNADTYTYEFGDGVLYENSDPIHVYTEGGTFTVQQVIENTTFGCVDTIVQEIVIEGIPTFDIDLSADTLCLGETLTANILNNNDSSIYEWEPNELFGTVNTTSVSVTPTSSFLLSLSETNYAGCIATLDSMISVIEPYAFSDWDTTIQQGKVAILPVVYDSLYQLELNPPESLSCLDCDFPEVTPEEDAFFTLSVQDSYGCFDSTYNLTVFVIPPSFISMPTSFTPNGDGSNDEVFVQGWLLESLEEFKIFNRWGELLFTSNSFEVGWDGTFNGKLQKSDVYVFRIKARGEDGNIVEKEGYINLIK